MTVGIETPSDATLQNYRRQTIDKDRQQAFIATCRELGIRTVAGFMIGFPEDTEQSIRRVRDYAIALGPTFANFNVVTPYPGTAFFEQMRDRLAEIDYSRFNVYTPMLKYDHLTPERIEWLLAKCFRRYYFRWQYLRENAAAALAGAGQTWPRGGVRRRGARAKRSTAQQGSPGRFRRGSAAPQGASAPTRRNGRATGAGRIRQSSARIIRNNPNSPPLPPGEGSGEGEVKKILDSPHPWATRQMVTPGGRRDPQSRPPSQQVFRIIHSTVPYASLPLLSGLLWAYSFFFPPTRQLPDT